MILSWDHVADFYGRDVVPHRWHLERAHNATYGLLCCGTTRAGDLRVASGHGEHAEERLVTTRMWRDEIPAALEGWTELDDQIVVTLVLNRSPCHGCAHLLRRRMRDLHRRFPVRMDRSRFILASLGAYEDSDMAIATTDQHLRVLARAGWELCVLRCGDALTERGEILRQGLVRVLGRQSYEVRLG